MFFLHPYQQESHKLLAKKLFKYKNLKFIDLSADFRLTNKNIYKKFYGKKHKAKNLIKQSIYSVSEFVKKKIKNLKLLLVQDVIQHQYKIPLIPLLKKKFN